MLRKILIADDAASIQNLIRVKLQANGNYKVRMSATVAETSDTCESFRPDLLIIDDLGGGGVAFGHARYLQGSFVIITSATVSSRVSAPQIPKGSPEFLSRLLAKVRELLGD